MNNSKLAVDFTEITLEEKADITPILRERETKLTKIINAIQGIANTDEWSTLKTEVFDGLARTLGNDIQREARKDSPDTLKLNRLAGQLKWAEKFSDLSKLENVFRTELTNIKKQLYGKKI